MFTILLIDIKLTHRRTISLPLVSLSNLTFVYLLQCTFRFVRYQQLTIKHPKGYVATILLYENHWWLCLNCVLIVRCRWTFSRGSKHNTHEKWRRCLDMRIDLAVTTYSSDETVLVAAHWREVFTIFFFEY